MFKKVLLAGLASLLMFAAIGCVTVQQRDQHTIDSLKGMRTFAYEALTDAAERTEDPLEKQETLEDRDTLDIEFDGLITKEEAKKDVTEEN